MTNTTAVLMGRAPLLAVVWATKVLNEDIRAIRRVMGGAS